MGYEGTMSDHTVGDADIVDDAEHDRLLLRAGGQEAELVYRREAGTLIIEHTGVPDAMAGHGVGGRLVAAALALAHAEGRTVVPWCPFARRWLREHPDAAPGPVDWATMPPR